MADHPKSKSIAGALTTADNTVLTAPRPEEPVRMEQRPGTNSLEGLLESVLSLGLCFLGGEGSNMKGLPTTRRGAEELLP